MGAITVVLPERVLKALEQKASASGKPLEELINDAILDQFSVSDPEIRAEVHSRLCEKYMREADELLARKNYVQASEKAWGAAAQIVKAIAAKRDRRLESHAALWSYVDELAEELGNNELRRLWRTANTLHQNFYENWMPPREVELSVKDVKTLIERLRKVI